MPQLRGNEPILGLNNHIKIFFHLIQGRLNVWVD
jgi:hypothetical protein